MSMINLSFDTQSKNLYVSINGQEVPNVRMVYVERYYEDEKPHIEIVTKKEIKEDGIVLENRVYASDMNQVSKYDAESVDIENFGKKNLKY